jgi:hypothetical protein
MDGLLGSKTIVKRVRIFSKFWVKGIKRNLAHNQTLVNRLTTARVGVGAIISIIYGSGYWQSF